MENILYNDTLRRIEMTALILESQDAYSENDLAEYFDKVSVQTIRLDAKFLREMGIEIHSSKPISDLRNKSNEISQLTKVSDAPVFITKNGEGDMVVMSMGYYTNGSIL